MRFTVILVVLCAIAMVTLANKTQKEKRLKKKMMRAEKMKQDQCEVISWNECKDGKITQTVSSNTSNPDCQDGLVHTESVTVDCVTKTNRTFGKGCQLASIYNFTNCHNVSNSFTVERTSTCRDKVMTLTKQCTMKVNKLEYKINKKKAGKASKTMKQQKKAFKKELKKLKSQGCIYKPTPCNSSSMEQEWTLKKGDTNICKSSLTKPCLGGKMKKNKLGKSKKNKSRRRPRKGKKACKYNNVQWSECDPITNKKTKQRGLKRGDPLLCNQTVIEEKPCKRKPRRLRESKCKYKKTQWSDCDPVTNEKTMLKTLKRGKPDQCSPTQVQKKICKRKLKNTQWMQCGYRGMTKWSSCDTETNTRSRKEIRKRGIAKFCQPTRIATKPCKKKGRKRERACQYDKSQWSPCDAATNTVTRTLTLKSGDPDTCNATKTIAKKCKDKHLRPHLCVYRRTMWGDCDPLTNMVSMQKTLKRGDPSLCDATKTVQKKCKRKKKLDVCKYTKAQWSECDQVSNTMTRTQMLTSGPSTCPSTKEFSRKCKKPCKFSPGVWSECDPETLQMKREEMLSKGNPDLCPPKRTLTKKCGRKTKKCQYDQGVWSECDQSDKPKRIRVQKLISGGENCKPEKETFKTCQKNSGKERCFFGPWSEFDECQNGVQKKRRQVLQGGLECESKSVKMKPC